MSAKKDKSESQLAAEEEIDDFREDLGPFVVAAETTRMAMVFTNAKGCENPIIFVNQSFLKLTGFERDEVLGQSFNSMMAVGAAPETLADIEAAFAGTSEKNLEICYRRKHGGTFWAAVFISPVRDDDGAVVQHFMSFVDLTDGKRERAQLRMLVDELNHRVKNTMSTVQSIVSQALRTPSDSATIKEAIESRIFALSRSHDLLTRENWEGTKLHDLLDTALEPFGVANGRAERFLITGNNIRLPPNAALALGIAFHELATNAVKYGAFSNASGSILVGWDMERTPDGERLVIRWRERDGPLVAPPTRRGFGSQVIERGLAHELGGAVSLEYPADGVICTITIPLPEGRP